MITTPAADHLTHLFADRTRPLLGAYWPAGFPSAAGGVEALRAFAAEGADILEVGAPHTHPHLDGPAITEAHRHALDHGYEVGDTLDTIWQLTATPGTAVVLMSYWEPVRQYGATRFAFDLAHAGAAAAMIPDLPEEYADVWHLAMRTAGLHTPRFVPWHTTTGDFAALTQATGWLYAAAAPDPTGYQGDLDLTTFAGHAARIRRAAPRTPLVAGIGVSTPARARALAPLVDGIVIGSPLIRAALEQPGAPGIKEAARTVGRFTDALTAASGPR
ncbi:tryptophan synthase subunit alpha [Streptacidiphilus sp. EB103A]|uniref:tryptophan synthase subunit alpha n=1 Tax=Streptacidiphilus sp. EB103A TaxID=3156275 RepID=UPI0035123484